MTVMGGAKLTVEETEHLVEADEFEAAGRDNTTTFEQVMTYLRKQEDMTYRQRCFRFHVPTRLKDRVELQCKLEGLL